MPNDPNGDDLWIAPVRRRDRTYHFVEPPTIICDRVRDLSCRYMIQKRVGQDVRIRAVETEGQEEARLRAAFQVLWIEKVMGDLQAVDDTSP